MKKPECVVRMAVLDRVTEEYSTFDNQSEAIDWLSKIVRLGHAVETVYTVEEKQENFFVLLQGEYYSCDYAQAEATALSTGKELD
jgi:hypothetical protein